MLFAFVLSRLVFLLCDGTAEIGSEFNSILVSNFTFYCADELCPC